MAKGSKKESARAKCELCGGAMLDEKGHALHDDRTRCDECAHKMLLIGRCNLWWKCGPIPAGYFGEFEAVCAEISSAADDAAVTLLLPKLLAFARKAIVGRNVTRRDLETALMSLLESGIHPSKGITVHTLHSDNEDKQRREAIVENAIASGIILDAHGALKLLPKVYGNAVAAQSTQDTPLLYSQPMTLSDLGGLFNDHKNTVAKRVKSREKPYHRVRDSGKKYQIPIDDMPPDYEKIKKHLPKNNGL